MAQLKKLFSLAYLCYLQVALVMGPEVALKGPLCVITKAV